MAQFVDNPLVGSVNRDYRQSVQVKSLSRGDILVFRRVNSALCEVILVPQEHLEEIDPELQDGSADLFAKAEEMAQASPPHAVKLQTSNLHGIGEGTRYIVLLFHSHWPMEARKPSKTEPRAN